MSFDPGPHGPLYLWLALGLLFFLVLRRIPAVRTLVSLAVWIGIAAALILVLGQRTPLGPLIGGAAQRFELGEQEVTGKAVRIRMSPDGHFWARAKFGAVERRFLIDSGATVTALSAATARDAGLEVGDGIVPILLNTANGTIRAKSSTIATLHLGNITARNLPVVVSPAFGDLDVLGMNFLSRLKSWRVEDGTLILVPHHPQSAASKGLFSTGPATHPVART